MLQWPRVRQQPHNRRPFVLLLNADLTCLPLSSAYSIEVDLPTNGEELNLDTPATSLVDVTIPQDTIPGSEFLVQIGGSEIRSRSMQPNYEHILIYDDSTYGCFAFNCRNESGE